MLKQKGTKSAVDKLVRSKFDTISGDVQFYEEWAIRTGSMVLIQLNKVELELDEAGFTDNPQILKTVKSVEEKTLGSKTEYTVEDFYKKPADINYDFIPTQKSLQFGHTSEQFHDKLLPNVGYPKLTDADATLFNSKDAQTLTPFLGDMKIGYTVWVANDGTNEWIFYISDNTKIIVTGNDGSVDGPNLYLTTPTNFMSGDIVAILCYTNKRDGVYNIPTNKSPN